ncbi:MAG TPA: lytic transglycosylase domain-containing protein [bacterium]|nr:lytic transglycosylase domain-containing protein [bacterium]
MRQYIPLSPVSAAVAGIVLFTAGMLVAFLGASWLTADPSVDIESIVPLSQVNFAGEPMPIDEPHYYTKEKFERELSVTLYSVYQVRLYHKREPLYIPHIEKRLRDAGVPGDFKYLAIAESALKNDAVSSASAAGIWQFIPDTARRYGLIVNDRIDERFNFEKSTDAAIAYLLDLYERFHDWTLVAAAYNRGENGLERDIAAQATSSYYDLYLNEETSRYVFRILAIKYVLENKNRLYDQSELGSQFELPDTREVAVKGGTDLRAWVREQGISYAGFRMLNPWILDEVLPEGTLWHVRLLE